MIPYGRQHISDADIDAVVEVLKSDFLTQGPKVGEFENAVARYVGAKEAVAVNSATSALHLACIALDVGPADVVWTSPVSFTASANCARYCGADVDFVDIDPRTGNLCPIALERKLKLARESDAPLPKVLVVVHFTGQPAQMDQIHALSVEFGFRIIEDAAHAIGASFNSEKVGRGRYSDITVFSFHPVKVITSGEGGMAVTNDVALARKLRQFASHGITRDPALMEGKLEGPWVYEQLALGFNYRMSDIHAALGLSQLQRLDDFVLRRNEIAATYDTAFKTIPCSPIAIVSGVVSAYHLYPIVLNKHLHRGRVFESLRNEGVGVNVHYIPIYKQPYYQELGFDFDYCPAAEDFYNGLITLPLFPSMTAKEIALVIDKVTQVLSNDSVVANPAAFRSNSRGEA